MEQGDRRGAGRKCGGIISLRGFIEEHKEAIESDLITSVGVELEDVGVSLSWETFASFLYNLGPESALWRSTHPEMRDWASPLRTNIILADIYDLLANINANLCGGFSRKKPHHVKPYPRPWETKKHERKIGSGALPKEQLHEWIMNYSRKKGNDDGG